jgi:uncharacterized protein (DUF58 family)
MADRTASPHADYLLSPEFLRRLEQATVASRRVLAGRTKGERRSAQRGASQEFADYRGYTPGDDLRYLDWRAYARLQRLFLKLFMEEEDLHVYFVVDLSQSMDFGSPSKLAWAREVAAALGYMALCSGDRVQVFTCGGAAESSRLYRGQGAAPEFFSWLSGRAAGGEAELSGAVRWLAASAPAPGLTFLLSDLLTPEWDPALSRLATLPGDAAVLHVLAPEEYAPAYPGDLLLVDSESGETREVTMGHGLLQLYSRERDAFLAEVRRRCFRYDFPYLFAQSDQRPEDVVLRSLRRLQVVK